MKKSLMWRLIWLAFFVLLLSACGRKTLPIPPSDAIPGKTENLRYQQDENQIVLTWNFPKYTAVGKELAHIQSFIVSRAVIPEKDYCPGCPVPFSSEIELDAETAIIDGKKRIAQYTETVLRPDHRYLYKVRTKAGWRLISEDSNTVSFSWGSPAEAPVGLIAEKGDAAIDLSWQPSQQLINKTTIVDPLLYQVYRGTSPDSLSKYGNPTASNKLKVSGLQNGKKYYFKVRALLVKGDTRIVGLPSRIAIATPVDLTPPARPRNMIVVKMEGGLKLRWQQNEEVDLAGYRIYRRLPGEKTMTLIGTVRPSQLSFADQQVPTGQEKWYYAISAFDNAEPANEGKLSLELEYEPF